MGSKPVQVAAIIENVERALAGGLPFSELRDWADELHAVAYQEGLVGRTRSERRRAVEALGLVATAADDGLFKTRGPCSAVLREVAATLRAGAPLAVADLYARLFQGQRELHLAARRVLLADPADETGEAEGDFSWADVVVRPAPGRASANDGSAVVAFAVVTERVASTDDPGHGAPIPGAFAAVRALAPNFAFSRYRPRLRRDVDGVHEFVLRTEEIDGPAITYAAKLFALLHGIERVTLDGEPLAVLRF